MGETIDGGQRWGDQATGTDKTGSGIGPQNYFLFLASDVSFYLFTCCRLGGIRTIKVNFNRIGVGSSTLKVQITLRADDPRPNSNPKQKHNHVEPSAVLNFHQMGREIIQQLT